MTKLVKMVDGELVELTEGMKAIKEIGKEKDKILKMFESLNKAVSPGSNMKKIIKKNFIGDNQRYMISNLVQIRENLLAAEKSLNNISEEAYEA